MQKGRAGIVLAEMFAEFDFSLLDSPDFKEDSVREEIVMPILTALGYSRSGTNKILSSKKLTHPFVQTGSGTRKITNDTSPIIGPFRGLKIRLLTHPRKTGPEKC